jgi:hypothetical protein
LISLHSSLNFPLSSKNAVRDQLIKSTSFFRSTLFLFGNYRQQSLITQSEVGMSIKYNVVNEAQPSVKTNLTLHAGASYRSYFRETRNEKRDAIALIFGMSKYLSNHSVWQLGLSHDLTVSELAGRTGGGWEISLSITGSTGKWEEVIEGFGKRFNGSSRVQSPRRYFFAARPNRECPYSSEIVPVGPEWVISKVAKVIRIKQQKRVKRINHKIHRKQNPIKK